MTIAKESPQKINFYFLGIKMAIFLLVVCQIARNRNPDQACGFVQDVQSIT